MKNMGKFALSILISFLIIIIYLVCEYKYNHGRASLEAEIALAISRNENSVVGPFLIVKDVKGRSEIWIRNSKYIGNRIEYYPDK